MEGLAEENNSVNRQEIHIELPCQDKPLNNTHRKWQVQFKWVVLCAAFANNFLVTGMASSFGVLYVEFLDAFDDSKAKTAAVGSLLLGAMFGAGPLVGYYSRRAGLRMLCMVGGILSSAGLLSSAFASSLLCLYFTYGVLAGSGFCCINLPSVVIVNQYFNKRRMLASTIAVSGCGVGSLLYPFVLRELIKSEGWRITLIYISAIQLQTCVLGMLFRPVASNKPPNGSKESTVVLVLESSDNMESGSSRDKNSIRDNEITIFKEGTNNGHASDESPSTPRPLFTSYTPTFTEHGSSSTENGPCDELDDRTYSRLGAQSTTLQKQSCNVHDQLHTSPIIQKDITRNESRTGITVMTRMILKQCRSGVFGNTRYLLFLITCLPYTAGVVVPAAVITDCILRRGGDKDMGALMVSVIGVAGTAGRIVAGLSTIHKKVDPLLFYTINRIISGASCILITYTLIDSISFLPIVIFGFSYGAVAGLDPPILTDLVGLSQLSMAYGYFALVMGIGCIISTPLAGFLVDEFDSYRIAFVVAGSMCISGGLALIPILIHGAPARVQKWIKGAHSQQND